MKIMKKSLPLLIAASLSFYGAVSTVNAKELPPQGGQPKAFELPATESLTLDNGLQITFIPYGKTPKATIRLITNTGNIDDGDFPWLSDISFEMLRQGTTAQSAKDIAEKVASMGGQINASVGMDASWLGADVLSEYTDDAIAIMAQMILTPALADSDLTRIKTDQNRNLKVQLSQPGNLANQAFYKAIFTNHPYGELYPTEVSLNGIDKTKVAEFLKNNLVPNRSHLYVSGVFDQAQVTKAIKEAFANWQKGADKHSGSVLSQTGPKVIMLERENSPQSTIRLGLSTISPSHPDFTQLTMMNTLLGGAFSSRITSNIRETKGYTYSPFSTVVNRVNTGLWYQAADITLESTGDALTEIFKEISLLANEAPSKDELEGIQNYMAGIFVLQNSSRSAVINQLAFMERHGLSEDYLKKYVERVYQVTPAQISEMVKKYVTPESMVLVTVGDKASLTPQLKSVEALKGYWK